MKSSLPSRMSGLIVLGVSLIVFGIAAIGMMNRGMGITLLLMGLLFFVIGWRWRGSDREGETTPSDGIEEAS